MPFIWPTQQPQQSQEEIPDEDLPSNNSSSTEKSPLEAKGSGRKKEQGASLKRSLTRLVKNRGSKRSVSSALEPKIHL